MNRQEIFRKAQIAKQLDSGIMITGLFLSAALLSYIGLHDDVILESVSHDATWLRRTKIISVMVVPVVPFIIAHLCSRTYLRAAHMVCRRCAKPFRAKHMNKFINTGNCPYCGAEQFQPE